MYVLVLGFVFALAGLALTGCRTTTTVDELRVRDVNIRAGESVVVLGRRHEMDKDTEADFIRCVGESMGSSEAQLTVVPEAQFVDALYPWFEASTAPMDVSNMEDLLQKPAVAKKLAGFGLRYFVWIDGFTETTGSEGSVSCAIGPGGGGCVGFKSWDDEANYEASIWDLKEANVSGRISTETTGTSYVPALIIPIPLLARVKATACDAMSEQLLSFMTPNSN